MIETNRAERPPGVTIIGGLMLLGWILALCSADRNLFDLVIAVGGIILAISFLSLQKWAYQAALVYQVFTLLISSRCGLQIINPLWWVWNLISIIVLGYLLLDGNVRRAFRA